VLSFPYKSYAREPSSLQARDLSAICARAKRKDNPSDTARSRQDCSKIESTKSYSGLTALDVLWCLALTHGHGKIHNKKARFFLAVSKHQHRAKNARYPACMSHKGIV
jgi:hypothetical protein